MYFASIKCIKLEKTCEYENLYENTRRLICFQCPVLLMIFCHKTKQKYTKYMHLDCPKSSKKCFQPFFSTHAWCISKKLPDVSVIFSILLHDVPQHKTPSWHDWKIVDWDVKPQHKQTNKTTCQKKSPKTLFLFSFQFLFLIYLLNNVSTRDISSFTSASIYTFIPVLEWSIIPCRKTCFIFTNQLLAPKQHIL